MSKQVTKNGKIIDEKTYRLNMAKKEHRKHVRDLLATAIVHKTLDIEVRCVPCTGAARQTQLSFTSLVVSI